MSSQNRRANDSMMRLFAPAAVGMLAVLLLGCRDSGEPTAPPNPTMPGQNQATAPSNSKPGDASSGSQAADDDTIATGERMPNAPVPAPPPGPDAPPEDPTVAEFLGLQADKPATWIWHPPQNRMIHTNYTVPAQGEGKPAFINVYFFGSGMGGTIESNIVRWQSQFRSPDGYAVEPTIERFDIDGMPVTLVELEGEWQQVGQAWFTKDQAFIAAIVEAPVGNIFIRFAGHDETVKANRERFLEMIQSLRQVEDVG